MPTLIDKTPPPSFARRKFIDPVRTKRTENVDLEPNKLSVLKHNKTLPQAVSVKPQVSLYKSLDPAIVPDVPASYFPQPDRHFQAMLAEPDMFHKYQTTQREAEASVGFFLDQELKREMAESNLDPYMYSRKQQKLDNDLNRLLYQPNRKLNPQEILALENRILGEDPRLLPDYASLSYIVRHSALLDFIRDRKLFASMTAWKTSFMNVLNNTFARLRITKPEWFNTVLSVNGVSAVPTTPMQPPSEPARPSREVRRDPTTGERTIVHTAPPVPSTTAPTAEIPDETLLKRLLNQVVKDAIGSEAMTKALAVKLYDGQFDGYDPIRITREQDDVVRIFGDINQYMTSSKLRPYGAGMEYLSFILNALPRDMMDSQTAARVDAVLKKIDEEIKRATIASEPETSSQDRSFLTDAENALKLSGQEQTNAIARMVDGVYARSVYKKPVEVAATNIVMRELTDRIPSSANTSFIGNILRELTLLLSGGAYKNEMEYKIAEDVTKGFSDLLKKKRP